MPTPKSIRGKVKTLIDGLSGFGFTSDFHDPNITGFPAITFDIGEQRSVFLTNKENLRSIIFNIIIYQELKNKGLSEAKRIVDERVEVVINAFANDFSLASEVDWCTPLEGNRGQFLSPNGELFFQQLNVECKYIFLTT